MTDPGPDRMVVFQNYSLLPWLTVRENIALAVDEVLGSLPKAERKQIVEEHIRRVGLQGAADKRPAHLSGDETAGGHCPGFGHSPQGTAVG